MSKEYTIIISTLTSDILLETCATEELAKERLRWYVKGYPGEWSDDLLCFQYGYHVEDPIVRVKERVMGGKQ